jgi:hypothetical protein
MFPKTTILLETIKSMLVFYEMAVAAKEGKAPMKMGQALEGFNEFCTEEDIEACDSGTAVMAKEYLDFIYHDAAKPEWVGE